MLPALGESVMSVADICISTTYSHSVSSLSSAVCIQALGNDPTSSLQICGSGFETWKPKLSYRLKFIGMCLIKLAKCRNSFRAGVCLHLLVDSVDIVAFLEECRAGEGLHSMSYVLTLED